MAGYTLAQAQTQLDAYLAAETAVLLGQKYEIAGRMMQRAQLSEIQQGIKLWSDRIGALAVDSQGRRRSRSRTVVVGF